jgi:nitroreductase
MMRLETSVSMAPSASRAVSFRTVTHLSVPLRQPAKALGLFAQNLMISAKARGIDTCPQVSFAPFHDVIASHVGMAPEEVTAFGMSMGYGAPDAPVNQTAMPRERVQDFARLVGFPE